MSRFSALIAVLLAVAVSGICGMSVDVNRDSLASSGRVLRPVGCWYDWLVGTQSLAAADSAGSGRKPLGGASADQPAPNAVSGESRVLPVAFTWGHTSEAKKRYYVRFTASRAEITSVRPIGFEPGDAFVDDALETWSGAGDVDGAEVLLRFPDLPVKPAAEVHSIWDYLIANSDEDTARRLRLDPACRPDERRLTVHLNSEGTSGFSVTVDQLLTHRVFWLPELDMFICAGEPSLTLAEHLKQLEPWRGRRILEQVEKDPEATYEQFTSRWEDMGSAGYQNPHSVAPGHIVCVTWDSAVPKFGVDRWGGVFSDYGNPDKFELALSTEGWEWKGQRLADGLPVVTTVFERPGLRMEIEQFAYPLLGPPAERRGDIDMVLFQKVRVQVLDGVSRALTLSIRHRRSPLGTVEVARVGRTAVLRDAERGRVLFSVQDAAISDVACTADSVTASLALSLPPEGSKEFVLKLPSPPVAAGDAEVLAGLDYRAARRRTLRFWSDYLNRGALFEVPEKAVNDLFRANLWHALRLPRRHGGEQAEVRIDLPYSNFAYEQSGIPWPVNQAVYVDYMLYDLRGYHSIADEELRAIYRSNQDASGRIGGFANWGVYTPSMVYAVAQHGLLSGDRESINALLPATLKAADWCLAEVERAFARGGTTRGLVQAPLNDLSHEARVWAFNQGYLYAGFDMLARLLRELEHPRAEEFETAASRMRQAVARGFGSAAAQAPLVQLRDHTWMPYVPSDALTPRRLLEVWYPTDVDTGPLHLPRLKALDPNSPLTTYMLNDHEDNVFIHGWGMANEPVYNQHALVYLLRDEPKAAIRAFYSMMACAFSHSVFEPVEHRWAWGQYFGPPSTDGAWFELYRNMLVRECDDGSLLLCQAVPRKWLEHGKRIRVKRAPTYYGPLSMTIESRAAVGEIRAVVELSNRRRPDALLVRFRHPDAKPMRSVVVNGRTWTDFDVRKEWVRIETPAKPRYTIVARY